MSSSMTKMPHVIKTTRGTFTIVMLLVCTSIVVGLEAQATRSYPVTNNTCPDFVLNHLTHYTKDQVALADFRGKWLVIDFFTKGCSGCFASFPKLNDLQKEFASDMQILLVGKNDNYGRDLPTIYEKFRHKQNLKLAVAYDTALFEQFGVRTVPHIVIIDPEGVVKAVTGDLRREDIVKMLKNEPVSFRRKHNAYESSLFREFDIARPLLIDGNGGPSTDFLFRSILTRWNPDSRQYLLLDIDNNHVSMGMFQGTGMPLQWLYNLAYVGKGTWLFQDSLYREISVFPVLEIADSSVFKPDFLTGEGVYNYSIIIPKEKYDKRFLMEVMQRDLKSYFGYDVSIEERYMPCWKLVASPQAAKRLKTKGGVKRFIGTPSAAGFSCANFPVNDILAIISGYHQSQPMFVHDTGIEGGIDISIQAIMTDLDDIKAALRNNGLDLVRGQKLVKAIVIRDALK